MLLPPLCVLLMLAVQRCLAFGPRAAALSRRCTQRLLSETTSSSGEAERSRFWTRSVDLRPWQTLAPDSTSSAVNVTARLEALATALREDHPDSRGVTSGIVLVPLSDGPEGEKKSILVPLHDGMVQPQHVKVINHAGGSNNAATLCAFSPRAQHVVVAPNEEERPVDQERFAALEAALRTNSNTTSEELLSDSLAATPPVRIYRSFVAPRPGKKHILEPVERAALRCAQQIDLALRQVRADQASYLRNTDRVRSALTFDDGVYGVGGPGGAEPREKAAVHPIAIVLDNVRSAFNVGSLFRTGETAGIAEVVTVGICPHPPHPKLRKTAMSAVDTVPTRHFSDIVSALSTLREEGYQIVAMETTSRSVDYAKAGNFGPKVALVLGNEVTGVDTRAMEMADTIVEIPTFGIKNSLCVSSAGPIVLFEVLRQWREQGVK